MINFTKNINDKVGNPYLEVDSTTDGAIEANNGKFYLSKTEIENRFDSGDFHLVYLQDFEFEKPVDVVVEWTLENHEKQLLAEHTAHCEALIMSLGYIDRVDMNTTAIAENDYKEEATALAQYWTDSYAELMAYLGEEPTEATQKTLLEIISPYNNE